MSKATGRIVYVPPPDTSHKCHPPVGWRKPVQGTVWRCDDCGKFWEWNWHTPDAWVGRSSEWVTSLGSWFELPDDYKPPGPLVPPDRKGIVYGRGNAPTKPPAPVPTGKEE